MLFLLARLPRHGIGRLRSGGYGPCKRSRSRYSGIGRAVALAFAKEGADVAISYLSEDEDAQETRRQVCFTSTRRTSRRSTT